MLSAAGLRASDRKFIELYELQPRLFLPYFRVVQTVAGLELSLRLVQQFTCAMTTLRDLSLPRK